MRRPDLLIALGVNPEAYRENNGYTISQQGKPPDFVLEVASVSAASFETEVARAERERSARQQAEAQAAPECSARRRAEAQAAPERSARKRAEAEQRRLRGETG